MWLGSGLEGSKEARVGPGLAGPAITDRMEHSEHWASG